MNSRWGKELVRHRAAIVIGVVLVVLTAILLIIANGGFRGNFSTEFLGMLWTVFIIDQIIKWREESRWRPSKDIISDDLMMETSTLLYKVYNNVLSGSDYHRVARVYTYGDQDAHVMNDQTDNAVSAFEHARDQCIENMTLNVEHASTVEDKNDKRKAKLPGMKDLHEAQNYFRSIFDRVYLVEPEILPNILKFDKAVTELKFSMQYITDWADNGFRILVDRDLVNIINSLLAIRAYLVKEADRYVTLDEFIESLRKYLEESRRSVDKLTGRSEKAEAIGRKMEE